MLFDPDALCTPSECLDQLLRVLALPKLFLKVASNNRLLVVAHLLLSDSLLKLLYLVKTADKVLFKVSFNIVCNCFHIVVEVIYFTSVELVLNVVGQLLIIILRGVEITRAFSFHEWSVEFSLILENLSVSLAC